MQKIYNVLNKTLDIWAVENIETWQEAVSIEIDCKRKQPEYEFIIIKIIQTNRGEIWERYG